MAFQTTISSIMTASSTLNKLVSGIYFDVLPINFDLKKDWIVYNYQDIEHIDVLSTINLLSMYVLYVKVVSPSTLNLLNITDAVTQYLTMYTSSDILDISFKTDNHSSSIIDDTDIFENTIEYQITYKK
jgi:hypothetical protein